MAVSANRKAQAGLFDQREHRPLFGLLKSLNRKDAIMANQTAQTAHQTILQHSNPENGTTCYSHAGCIINPFLAVVAIPEQYHADLAAQSCRWQPLGLHTSEQAAEAGYSIMQPGSPLFDRLLARLPQTSR